MAFPSKNYTLGSGKLFFDAFALGTLNTVGQRYFGNTPDLKLKAETETTDHYDADNGLRQKDDTIVTQVSRAGSFITDHISPENLALFFLGTSAVVTQAIVTGATWTSLSAVKLGLRYQIGASASLPAGVRNVTAVIVKVGAVTKTLGTDYSLDAASGGVTPLVGGSIVDGVDSIIVTYSVAASTFNQVVSADNAAIYGALYFQANNGKGVNFDYFFPYVAIKPNGDFSLKSDKEYQQISFDIEVLKKDATTASVYINGRPGEV